MQNDKEVVLRRGNKRALIALTAITVLILASIPMAGASSHKQPPKGGVQQIQIIQYSDWHGQLDPIGGVGGAAALATYFKQERAANANTIVITGGDDFGATPPLSNFFRDVPAVLAQNLMGLDVGALGNHNFDRGVGHLQEMVDLAEYTYLGANLLNLEENVTGIEPYKIFNFPGVRVAVIGVTNEEAPTLVFPGSFGTIEIADAAETAQRTRDELARRGVNVFILVAHKGLRTLDPPTGELIDLANAVHGFDLVLGDHTDIQFAGVINDALVVENRSRGLTYSRITLDVLPGRHVVDKSVEFVVPTAADVDPDPAVEAMLQPFRDQLEEVLTEVVGHSTVEIPRSDECGRSDGRLCESLVGNVVTDALRLTYETDFAITNSGGLRAPLTCPEVFTDTDFCPEFTPPPYPITQGQVLTVLPFGNTVVTVDVTGVELKAWLEHGVSAMPGANGRFAQVSGLCFIYDVSAPVGDRVISVVTQEADGSCTGPVVDLSAGATYSLATNDFMAAGGDEYPSLTGFTTRDFMDQVVAMYVEAEETISPEIQGRITCTGAGCPTPLP